MKTAQSMLNSKYDLDMELIEDNFIGVHQLTYLDDAILDDCAPTGDMTSFWNYIDSVNL